MTFELRNLLDNPANAWVVGELVKGEDILQECGIDPRAYANYPEKFIPEILDHVFELIDERAEFGQSYTAWDGNAEEEFSINVRNLGCVWYIAGGGQFDGYFHSEIEANKAAELLALCMQRSED